MIIHEITEECFKKYGKVIDSIDLTELVSTMQTVEIPADVVYEPSISALEELKCATELQQKTYGELPIQIGWCIGNNHKLNAVEYHRCSEVNIAATDAILILGRQQDISVENTLWKTRSKILISLRRIYTILKENCYICRQKHKI